MRAPAWFRRFISRHRRHGPSPTAPVRLEVSPGQFRTLSWARGRLAHQKKQIEKAERDLKHNVLEDATHVKLKARLDGVIGKGRVVDGKEQVDMVTYWEDMFQRLGGDLDEFNRTWKGEQ